MITSNLTVCVMKKKSTRGNKIMGTVIQTTLQELANTDSYTGTAESYAKSLGGTVVLHKHHATAARFPTRAAFNLFIKFLVNRDYNYRLTYATAQDVAFSIKSASLELRQFEEERFALGVLR